MILELMESFQQYIILSAIVAVFVIYLVSMLFFSNSKATPDEFIKSARVPTKIVVKSKKDKQQAKKKAKKALKVKQTNTSEEIATDEAESVSGGNEATDVEDSDVSAKVSLPNGKKSPSFKEIDYDDNIAGKKESLCAGTDEGNLSDAASAAAAKKKKRSKKKKSGVNDVAEDVAVVAIQVPIVAPHMKTILKNANEHSPVSYTSHQFPHVKVPKDEIELAKMKHLDGSSSVMDDVGSTSSRESKSMKKRNRKKQRDGETKAEIVAATTGEHVPDSNSTVCSSNVVNHSHTNGTVNETHVVSTSLVPAALSPVESVTSLSTQLHRKNEELSSLTKEVNRLKRTLESREVDLNHQREQLREFHQMRAEYGPLKEIQAKYANMEKSQRILQEQFANKVQQTTGLEDEIKKLQKHLEANERDNRMKINQAELEKKLLVLEGENSKLKVHLNRIDQELHGAQNTAMEKERESQRLRKEIENTQELYRQRDAYLNDKDNELKKVQSEIARISYELKQEKFRGDEACNELLRVQQQCSVDQDELHQLKQMANSMSDYSRLSNELESIRTQLKEKHGVEANLREELNGRDIQHRHALEKKEYEVHECLAQVNAQRDDAESSWRHKIETLEAEHKALVAVKQELEHKLEESSKPNVNQEEAVLIKERETAALRDQNKTLEEQLNGLKLEINAVQSKLDSHVQEATAKEQRLHELEELLSKEKDGRFEAVHEVESRYNALSEKFNQVQDTPAELSKLKEHLQETEHRLKSQNERTDALLLEKEELQKNIHELQEKCSSYHVKEEAALSKVEECNKLHDQLRIKEESESQLKVEIDGLHEKLKLHLAEKEKSHYHSEELERVVETQSKQIGTLNDHVQSMEESSKHLKEELAHHIEKIKEISLEKEKFQSATQELEKVVHLHVHENAHLKEQLHARDEAENHLKQERDHLDAKVKEILDEKDKTQAHYQHLLAGTEEVLHKLQNSIQNEEEKWRANLTASEQECVQLKGMISQLEASSSEKDGKVKEANETLSALQSDFKAVTEELQHVRSSLSAELDSNKNVIEKLHQELEELSKLKSVSATRAENEAINDNSSSSLNDSQTQP